MKSYKELIVWKKSVDLVTEIYKITHDFPQTEQYGLVSQMRRAAVSIPPNIAEGYTREHTKEYIQSLRISFASGAELETQILLSLNLSFLSDEQHDKFVSLLTKIMKMLNVLIRKLSPKH